MALTKKQKEVLEYIKSYQRDNDLAPTQKEIKDHFGLKSFGSVNRYMKYLIEANLIEMDWNARRGIRLINSDLDTELKSHTASSTIAPQHFEEIPLLGDVAAGNPIEALENPDNTTHVPIHMISRPGKYYALNVCGDSMIEDGIHEGDVLVCRHQENANQGQTVIALVDNEATVKKFYKKKATVELHPANERLKPFVITPEQDFRIAGVVVGLLRSYE
ncbi:MAG: repressor LexA [Bacteriovorax sp. MedPE-SWde]|nr:MAG: repressor LexA [Bacteriovorax sp. MedPE-SWde]